MKKKHNPLQVRIKLNLFDRCLIFIVSFLIIVVLIVFHVFTYNAKESQRELIAIVMEKMSANQKTQFESYIDDRIEILEALAAYPDIYQMNDEEQKEFLQGRAESLGFHHLFVVNTKGMGYYVDEDVHRDQSDDPFFYDIMQNEVFVTEPFFMDQQTTIMTACVSVYDTQGEKVGILCGAITLDNIQELIQNNEMILHGDCFILNRAGNFITDQKNGGSYESIYDIPNSELSLIKSSFRDEKDLEGVICLEGVEYEGYFTYLEDYKWVIVQCIPMTEITQRFEHMTIFQGILIFLAAALIFCVFRIVYSWKKSDKKIYTDSLTKGNNRAACISMIESLEKKRNAQIAVIYMDLNYFKQVNDTYGHEKGDELLCIFSKALEQVFGSIGFVGRMGGDEFIAILLDTCEAEIRELCQQVEGILGEKSKGLDFSYVISSSYGFFIREKGEEESLQEVMQKADERMYEYKEEYKKEKNEK